MTCVFKLDLLLVGVEGRLTQVPDLESAAGIRILQVDETYGEKSGPVNIH